MNKRRIVFYWLLLLVPTLIIGVAALRLFRHEQERIRAQAMRSALERLEVIADSVQTAVKAVEQELMDALRRLPEADIIASLREWEQKNPLVRNVFLWDPQTGLQYPLPGRASTDEEQCFMKRYDALFSGRVPWKYAVMDYAPEKNVLPSSSRVLQQPQRVSGYGKSRRALVDQARVSLADSPETTADGWIPWFTDNQLHFLGWVQKRPNGKVYGIELEFMVLLSQLTSGFPNDAPAGCVHALVDGEGQLIHQAGGDVVNAKSRPELAVSLSPQLPHWQVVMFCPSGLPGESGNAFVILSSLLLAIFVAAIIMGGSLLTWQAQRNMRDARQKTSFVSNVSHELKTPLTSIRMYAELLNEDRIKDEQKKKQYLGVIALESQRLTRLVNNVLDFGRLEEGRKKYRLEDIEMTGFLNRFVEAHRLRINEASLRLEANLADAEVLVLADRDAFEQVLLNLVDNAIKYAADGGELVITLDAASDLCRLRVMDRGSGVPPAQRNKIFEKFHRVDDSITTRHPGSGLGLSIARSLLRGMGGDLIYEPREGGGSCFIVTIPLCISGVNIDSVSGGKKK